MTAFKGIITPLCTPLAADGTVDARSLERLVGKQLEAGVNGVFALGSSGEAIYLDDDSRARVLGIVVATVAGAVPVFAGALAGSTARVVQQIRWISGFAVDAIVVTAPFYANVSDAETVTHFETVAAASKIPVIAYDIPGNVGRKLAVDVTVDLLKRKVLAGLKDTSGDLPGFFRILAEMGDRSNSSIMTGSDKEAARCLAAGADGIVPGLGNVCPDLFVGLYAAHLRGDTPAVQRFQDQIADIVAIFSVGMKYGLGRHASELGALKFLLYRAGIFDTTVVSLPLTPYPDSAGAEVASIVERIGR
jgi:4-hydroxy-tetrahydrodipicolinate synthase